jgi:hypothetical protein
MTDTVVVSSDQRRVSTGETSPAQKEWLKARRQPISLPGAVRPGQHNRGTSSKRSIANAPFNPPAQVRGPFKPLAEVAAVLDSKFTESLDQLWLGHSGKSYRF